MSFSPYKLAKMYLEDILNEPSFSLNNFIANPVMIDNIKLRYDILKCCSYDITSSHEIEMLKHTVGNKT